MVATPERVATPLVSVYDVLDSISDLNALDDAVPKDPPYAVDIVSQPWSHQLAS